MAPDTEERVRREDEEIDREMEMIRRDRPETDAMTRSAVRRTVIALTVMALGVLLWRCST